MGADQFGECTTLIGCAEHKYRRGFTLGIWSREGLWRMLRTQLGTNSLICPKISSSQGVTLRLKAKYREPTYSNWQPADSNVQCRLACNGIAQVHY